MPLMQNLARLFAAPAQDPAAAALYRTCVLQARAPVFYRDLAVPDSIDGRFDLLVLHVALVMLRLEGEDDARQQLFDMMFADMDQSLREMGVGDMGIGKRVKPMIAAFYGRMQAYGAALAENDDAVSQVLARNLYGKIAPPPESLRRMTAYVRAASAHLAAQNTADLLAGDVEFVSVP
jgi:cytochrome b pre-mRNA-processing protein 3